MSEFSLIDAIRTRCGHARRDVALGIGDDAALLEVPAGRQLVACTDSMVAGVHFLADTDAADLGWKSLAVNLSDLAAMGAEPAWALLAVTMPEADAGCVEGFVGRFAGGFAELAALHDVALVGGDTTQGPLSITVTALGTAPRGEALTRGGARMGDAVFVTGTLGDAAGALRLLRVPSPGSRVPKPQSDAALAGLARRMLRPEPRITAGLALRGVASACIDVSDGLVADLGHVCEASGVGAEIDADALPVSQSLRSAFDDAACRGFALAGGDDYELCFTAPEIRAAEIQMLSAGLGVPATRIGRVVAGRGVRVRDRNGNAVETPHAGWEHFRTGAG
ncbi:MAG: thiamine-phosphate kinase [Rhodanobacteraceae bacterium]